MMAGGVAFVTILAGCLVTGVLSDETTLGPEYEVDNGTEYQTIAVTRGYKEAENDVVAFVNSLLKSLLPKVISGAGASDLSPRCTAAMMKIFGNIRRLKGWTVKMLDSMGKPASGIMKGVAYSMGNYDQCLEISVTKRGHDATNPEDEMFGGMYCRVRVRFEDVIIERAIEYNTGLVNDSDLGKLKDVIQGMPFLPGATDYMNHYLGMCLPSTCTQADVEQLIKLLPFPGSAALEKCERRSETSIDYTQLMIIYAYLALLCIAFMSTFIDWLRHFALDKNRFCSHNRCVSVSIAFSFCNNTKSLMKYVEDDSDGLLARQSVRGIVVISVAWIILGNTYFFPYEAYYKQTSFLENLSNYLDKEYFAFIVSFPFAYDALFVCYGFLLTFPLWYSASKMQNVSVKMLYLIIKNYIRLCIPILMCLGVVILLPLIGSGPFWKEYMNVAVQQCQQNAEAHVGMYSNFMDLKEQCFPHLWFISCLAQLILVGIVLSWILSKSMKVGILLLVLATVLCNIAVGILSYKNSLPSSYIFYFTGNATSVFWRTNLSLPLSHFGSFAIGMLTGVLVARRVQHRIKTCLSIILWVICISLLYCLVLILYKYRDGSLGTEWSAAFAGIHKTLFAACVAWIIVACSFGSGGFVNAILSWRIFDPLCRLSLYAYVFHLVIIAFTIGISRDQWAYSHVELMLRALSFIVASYVISYFLFMLLEMPLKSLQSAFCGKKSSQISVTPLYKPNADKYDIFSPSTVQGSCKLWAITETKSNVY